MMSSQHTFSSTSWRFFLIEQAAWLLLSAFGAWAALILRLLALELFIYFQVSHWSLSILDKTATLVIFILWLIGSAWLQNSLGKLGSIRKVLRASALILAALVILLGAASLIRLLIT